MDNGYAKIKEVVSKNAKMKSIKELLQLEEYREISNNRFLEYGDQYNSQEVQYIQAFACFKVSKWQECISYCKEIFVHYEDSPDFLGMYGAALRRTRELTESQRVFEYALDKFPENPVLLNNYCNLIVDLGNPRKAEEILTSLSNTNPVNLNDVRSTLERAKEEIRKNEEIVNTPLDIFKEAFADSEKNLSTFSEDKVKKDAIQNTTKNAKKMEWGKAKELIEMAKITSRSNQDLAINDCLELRREIGPCPEIYDIAGFSYIQMNKLAHAEYCYLMSIVLGSNKVEALLNMASIACIRKDHQLAKAFLESASAHTEYNIYYDHALEIKKQIERVEEDRKNEVFPFAYIEAE